MAVSICPLPDKLMIDAEAFFNQAREHGFGLFTGVPCSYLKPFINYCIDAPEICYVPASNEGDAVAIAVGAQLGGIRAVAMFQNSGLGNAVNPLTSLTYTFRIPVLLIVTLRGEPGGAKDEPQHELMGSITTGMLEMMKIPWRYFPTEPEQVAEVLEQAVTQMDQSGLPFALVMQKGAVAEHALQADSEAKPRNLSLPSWVGSDDDLTRRQVLSTIQSALLNDDIVLATTGYTGRELYACDDLANQFYMVGSMGCVSSLGLGLALSQPQRRIIVIDGDGALLMRMGALATIGFQRPANLLHILLDNGIHESTGGQATVSRSLDIPTVAAACGYPTVIRAGSLQAITAALDDKNSGLRFLYIVTAEGVPTGLPRPRMTPVEVAGRLQTTLADIS